MYPASRASRDCRSTGGVMQHICDRDVAERYVAGTLPDGEAELFEEHFFECKQCAVHVSAQTILSSDRTLGVSPRAGRFRLFTPPDQVVVAGSLAQAASLVSYGNAALASGEVLDDEAWARLSPFHAANSITFVRLQRIYGTLSLRQRVAGSPEEWLIVLKRLGATTLQLRVRAIRGAVIRVVATNPNHRAWWQAEQRYLGDQLNRRIWDVSYSGSTDDDDETEYRELLDVETATANLHAALPDALERARVARLHGYHVKFLGALHLLTSPDPRIPHYPDLLADPRAAAKSLAAACVKALSSPTQTYDDVSTSLTRWRARRAIVKRLRDAVLDALAAAANAPGDLVV
jgi:hypothetical protein